MNALNPIIILLAAYLAVYFQSSFDLFRNIFGAQINLLPALMVYTSLTMGIFSVALFSIVSGLLFDSLSANSLGISVVPLFIIGFAAHRFHGLLLREQPHAQFSFGAAASLLMPLLTLLFLFNGEGSPLFGWGTMWQMLVMGLGGGMATPVCFRILDWVSGALNYQPIAQTSFRADRQIKRNRGT